MCARLLSFVATAIVLGAARAAILLRVMLLHASASGQTRAFQYTRTRLPKTQTNSLVLHASVGKNTDRERTAGLHSPCASPRAATEFCRAVTGNVWVDAFSLAPRLAVGRGAASVCQNSWGCAFTCPLLRASSMRSQQRGRAGLLTVAMADPAMIKRLENTAMQFEGLTQQLGDPSLDTQSMLKITMKRASLEEVVTCYNDWKESTGGVEEAKLLFQEAGDDPEMKEMAREEMKMLEPKILALEERLKILMLPKVRSSSCSCTRTPKTLSQRLSCANVTCTPQSVHSACRAAKVVSPSPLFFCFGAN